MLFCVLLLQSQGLAAQQSEEAQKQINQINFYRSQIVAKTEKAMLRVKNSNGLTGSGFIISINQERALVLTNYHVILDAKSIEIKHTLGGTAVENDRIKIIATNPHRDIALLSIDGVPDDRLWSKLTLDENQTVNDLEELKSRDYLIVANSRYSSNFLTSGVIGKIEPTEKLDLGRNNLSAEEYRYMLLLFQSSITPGNSGSPVIDFANDKVVGIATGSTGKADFMSFAIPIVYALELIKKGREPQRGPPGFSVS